LIKWNIMNIFLKARMGLRFSTEAAKSPPPALREREDDFTVRAMGLLCNDIEYMSEHIPTPSDNSTFSYNFEPLMLPVDAYGYIQSFLPTETQAIQEFFDKYGVVVVRNCLNEIELTKSINEAWSFLERHSDSAIDRNDSSTWIDKNWPRLQQLGILGDNYILSPQMVLNRSNSHIHSAFSAVLRSTELITGIQRLSMMRPTAPPNGRPEWRTATDFLHVDMCPCCGGSTTFGFQTGDTKLCTYDGGTHVEGGGDFPLRVQGFTALWDCPVEAGGFQVIPGFHRYIRGWAHQLKQKNMLETCRFKGNATSFDVPHDDPLRTEGHAQPVPVRAGSCVIWSSALPHGTFPCSSGERGRLVQYITKARVDDKAYKPLSLE
jgi:ectoine hydroxylase-related dioxygenase (phytanoyl-CoA dioxygenase family)